MMHFGRIGALAVTAAFALSACAFPSGSQSAVVGAYPPADAALEGLQGKVFSKGPNGEDAAKADTAMLTDAEIEQIKGLHATAAISMHTSGDDWSHAQINGLRSEFSKLGIEIVAVTDAGFDPKKQVSDLQTIMAKKPNIIVSLPTDPVATASAYKAAAAGGAKLVFMDNVPKGLSAGTDYVTSVSADNFGNGVISAHLMAKALGGKGTIGVIYHDADFFVTRQRYDGFRITMGEEYPDIKIVESRGVGGPDFAGGAQNAANAILSKRPDINGIWAVWDVPAEGVLAAARSHGRLDLKIATEDLGTVVAINMASKKMIVGLGAQVPFDQGVTEARLGAGALIGKPAPPYVALSALAVTHDNVMQAWKQVYHEDPPAELQKSFTP
jgi:ribose transport system substrate-binding protein